MVFFTWPKFLRCILPQIEGTPGEDESRKFSCTVFMTTESCTTTSVMTTRSLRAENKGVWKTRIANSE